MRGSVREVEVGGGVGGWVGARVGGWETMNERVDGVDGRVSERVVE